MSSEVRSTTQVRNQGPVLCWMAASSLEIPKSLSDSPIVPRTPSNFQIHLDEKDTDEDRAIAAEMMAVAELLEAPLGPQDEIPQGLQTRSPATLTFKDVAFAAKQQDGSAKVILEPVSGSFRSGNLVAIMGPSGCGKSTLLDMLAMKKTSPHQGEILVNGRPRDRLFSRIAAYVGQEDVMPQHWTVREAVEFNMQLKAVQRSRALSPKLQRGLVDVILAAFGLSSVAETFIGGPKVRGISGGQRRRVVLARGVAQQASLLFCDEPTSGLSATDAELCIKALRVIAKRTQTLVLVVIHQPRVEVAALFDHLLLLTSNPGRLVYLGPMAAAVEYWGGRGLAVPQYSNPTDFFLDTVTPGGALDHADELVASYLKELKPANDKVMEQRRSELGLMSRDMILEAARDPTLVKLLGGAKVRLQPVAASPLRQLGALMRRKWTLTKRDRSAILLPVVMPSLTGVLVGLMFQGVGNKPLMSQLALIFMMMTRICFGGMQLMPAQIESRNIMKLEVSEGLYAVPSFLCMTLVDMAISFVGTVAAVTIEFGIAGIHWEYYGLVIGWGVLLFLVFDSFFGLLASTAASQQSAQVMATPVLMIFMMFSGFMVNRASSPSWLRWVFEVSPLHYAMENIFSTMAEDYGQEGAAVVGTFGFEANTYIKGVPIMLGMVLVIRVLQVLALMKLNNVQK